MAGTARWNLSTDYYDIMPATSDLDGGDFDSNLCEVCGKVPYRGEDYFEVGIMCYCNDYEEED